MNTSTTRDYPCKDGELLAMAAFVTDYVKRDAADFKKLSSKYGDAFFASFDELQKTADAQVNPKLSTGDLKATTAHLHSTMDGLLDTSNRVEVLIDLAKDNLPIPESDFGLSNLRKKLHSRDAENSVTALNLLASTIVKYREPLAAVGLSDETLAEITGGAASIAADNRQQNTLLSQRKELVKNNISTMNGIYNQVRELCKVGKAIYRLANPDKAKEYSITDLMKKVRHPGSSSSAASQQANNAPQPADSAAE